MGNLKNFMASKPICDSLFISFQKKKILNYVLFEKYQGLQTNLHLYFGAAYWFGGNGIF